MASQGNVKIRILVNFFSSSGIGTGRDIFEMSESLNLKGYIEIFDIEKAFDSLSHSFLLKKFFP